MVNSCKWFARKQDGEQVSCLATWSNWVILVLNKGTFEGEQLISEEYLAKATSGIVKPTQDWIPKDYRYGYFWYQTLIKVGSKNYDTTFAWGGGGQRIIVIEELDLTIVISGHDGDDKIMTQISEIIIPAFAKKQ